MDPEEERVLYLRRVGSEKIFKCGTYTVTKERTIIQDHPFYARMDNKEPDDPETLAAQVISSNFKVGLSQDEVDALLGSM